MRKSLGGGCALLITGERSAIWKRGQACITKCIAVCSEQLCSNIKEQRFIIEDKNVSSNTRRSALRRPDFLLTFPTITPRI